MEEKGVSQKKSVRQVKRLEILQKYDLLNEGVLEDLQEVVVFASKICEVPASLVSVVGEEKQYFKAKIGNDKLSTPIHQSFCRYTIEQDGLFQVPNARADKRFQNNPLVIADNDPIIFYAGFPIQLEGENVATICVHDQQERKLNQNQIDCLELLSSQVSKLLELKQHKFDLTLKNEVISQQNKELKENNMLVKQLISMISHDVKGPIGSILTFFQTDKGAKDKDFILEKILPLMKTSLKGVYDMIDNMLAWSNTYKESNSEHVDLVPIIENISNIYASQLSFKNLEIQHDIKDSLKVRFNGSSLQFILRNLVGNAIKFSEGSKILIKSHVEGEKVTLSVIDSGTGIPEQRLEKILDRDIKVTTQGTQKEKGSGMGLNFIMDLLRKHNSELHIESKEGEGTHVSFSIPLSN